MMIFRKPKTSTNIVQKSHSAFLIPIKKQLKLDNDNFCTELFTEFVDSFVDHLLVIQLKNLT